MSDQQTTQRATASERRQLRPGAMSMITIRLTAAEHERFAAGAKLDGQSLNQWCLEALRCWCDSAEEMAVNTTTAKD